MVTKNNVPKTPVDPLVIVVKRQFSAPPKRVFDAWLNAESLGRWLFATPGGVMKRIDVDPRVGGQFVVAEQRGDVLAEHHGRYEVIDRPRQLVFLFSVTAFKDPEEAVSRVSIEIVPDGAGCELRLTHEIDRKWAEYAGRTRDGWTMILENLDSVAESDREVVNQRIFDVAHEKVFQAFSDPTLLASWWGPNGFTNTIQEFDFRPGGKWVLTMHGPNGVDFENESVFREVIVPERIVFTHLEPVHRFDMTMNFREWSGQTALTWRMRFDAADECEKVRSFVEVANERNFDRLAECIHKMV
ncbi:MAG TPA: SRPBCC domain-containing protein [Lacipirellulaceae bacterium]|jgi:uncharacterized protein YndB with AHSA1/START domain|nr:SRPBCC domain-containing protein [Lacipirellulaceae bacterium]